MDLVTQNKGKIEEDYELKDIVVQQEITGQQLNYNMKYIMDLLKEKQKQLGKIIEGYCDESSCISISDKLTELRTQMIQMNYQPIIEEIDLAFFIFKGCQEFQESKQSPNELPNSQQQDLESIITENNNIEEYLSNVNKEIDTSNVFMETHSPDNQLNSNLESSSSSLDSEPYSQESASCNNSNNDSSWRPSQDEQSMDKSTEMQENSVSRTNSSDQQKEISNQEESEDSEDHDDEQDKNSDTQQEEKQIFNVNITKEDISLEEEDISLEEEDISLEEEDISLEEEKNNSYKNIKKENKNQQISLDLLSSLTEKVSDSKLKEGLAKQFTTLSEISILRRKLDNRRAIKPKYFETYIKRLYSIAGSRNWKVPSIFVSQEYFDKPENVMLNETERQFVFDLFRLLGTVIKVEKILFLPKRLIKKIVVEGALALKKQISVLKNNTPAQQTECIIIDSDDQDDTTENINTHDQLRHYLKVLEEDEIIQSRKCSHTKQELRQNYYSNSQILQYKNEQSPVKSGTVNEKEKITMRRCNNVKLEGYFAVMQQQKQQQQGQQQF